jgi:type I restriction enzyme S subunit
MNQPLPAYPDYKPASLPWLEQVPAHWDVIANRHIFAERKERGHIEEELLSVTIKQGIIRQSDLIKNSSKKDSSNEDKSKYKLVKPGDFAYNKMRMWQGAVGYSDFRGIVSPAYIVLEPIATIDTRYYHYLMRTPEYVKESYRYSYGICDDQLSLRYEDFRVIKTVLPPLAEQQQMVSFLDTKEQRIARLLRAKRRLIKLIQEQKQALIHHAVTKGLNPNAPRKGSGVAWLGEVPAHWEVRKVKHLTHIKTGGKDTENKVEDGAYQFFVRSQTIERINSFSFDGEAVLTAGDGAGVAKVFHYVNGKFDYHQRVYKFSHFRRVTGKFFFYYLRSTLWIEALDASAKSTVDSLRLPLLQNFAMTVPPSEEQLKIVAYIEHESKLIDETIDRAQREIELIQEYRTRLVADVVTGRVDVRGLTVASSAAADLGLLDEEEAFEEELLEETVETDG